MIAEAGTPATFRHPDCVALEVDALFGWELLAWLSNGTFCFSASLF